jgi:hypothetical protein
LRQLIAGFDRREKRGRVLAVPLDAHWRWHRAGKPGVVKADRPGRSFAEALFSSPSDDDTTIGNFYVKSLHRAVI